jgi:hypothetical protein
MLTPASRVKLGARRQRRHLRSPAIRDCGKKLHSRGNFEDRIKARDFQQTAYSLAHIHYFEADSFCLDLLAQLEQSAQSAGIDNTHLRQV